MEWVSSMFVFLGTNTGLIIVCALAILVIVLAVMGKVSLKFGKNIVTFGRTKIRSCGDCILLVMSKRERYGSQKEFVLNSVLKEQMNFVEQKSMDVQGILLSSYREQMCNFAPKDTSHSEFNKQYRLYQGLLINSFCAIKDEFRRSFKENGFEEMSGQEFSHYVKNKVTLVVSIGRDPLFNLYPYEGMIVTVEERTKWLDSKINILEDICFEIFVKAKEIKLEATKKVALLDREFSKEIDELISRKENQ